MWREDFDALGLGRSARRGRAGRRRGRPRLLPGLAHGSPPFSFAVTGLRSPARATSWPSSSALRRRLVAEGLCEPQKALARPALPRTIGVVCGERGKARDDVLAGLRRRGWAGRLVWAFAPVQDRHAAPARRRALSELAALPDVDVAIVARGGGSLADLLAFCDETLCRTVALLRVPVIASVGHHTDRTLIDDVAAVSCSTPTHAAEAAVPLHVGAAREALGAERRGSPATGAGRWPTGRASSRGCRGRPASTSRATAARCTRTCASCGRARGGAWTPRQRRAPGRGAGPRARRRRGPAADVARRRLDGLAAALAAHDPERTLARGYALVQDAPARP